MDKKSSGNVHLELFGPDGKLKEERWANNMVLNGGLTWAADKMSVNSWSDATSAADGIICGGMCSAAGYEDFETVIRACQPYCRLNGIKGHFGHNLLVVDAADPDYPRYDVVYMISPGVPTYPYCAPDPPRFDTCGVAGTPSATPVLPGSPYDQTAAFVSTGYDGTVYFASLYSYYVTAGTLSSSEYTDWTDRRTIVADDLGYNAISHMAFGDDGTAPAGNQTGPIHAAGLDFNKPLPIDSLTHDGGVITVVGTFYPLSFTGEIREACLYAMYSETYITRVTFDVINKGDGDTLVVTWTITITDI